MQWMFICALLVSVICVVIGFRKSPRHRLTGPRQYCAVCGWTREPVQPCRFEQQHSMVVAPLCFDCCVRHDALPYRELPAGSQNTVCA
jgi:hypothetical protein